MCDDFGNVDFCEIYIIVEVFGECDNDVIFLIVVCNVVFEVEVIEGFGV